MFTAFYGMNFNPFSKEIDVKYQFKSNDFVQSTSRLEYLKQAKGVGLIIGSQVAANPFR